MEPAREELMEEEGDEEKEEVPHERGNVKFNYIEIRGENARRFRNFRILRKARIKILPPAKGTDIANHLENAFREIYSYAVNSANASDYVGLSFTSMALTRGPAGLSFRLVRDLTYEDVWGLVSSVAQSAESHDIAERFLITVYNVGMPLGRGGKSNKLTRENMVKRSILNISNRDNMCLPRSLVVARVYCKHSIVRTGELHKKCENIRHPYSALQRCLAEELTRNAGIVIPEEGCGIPEIERFQQLLSLENIVIVVYNFRSFGRGVPPLYDRHSTLASRSRIAKYTLNIMYYERSRHYKRILNLKAASASIYYCVPCNKGYRHETGHRCSNTCPRYLGAPPCEKLDARLIGCDACNRVFYGESCFERHRAPKSYAGRS
ncbi:uncharacterized protein LOC116851349 isoform X1 [Odontomachus brunneus]|uniref:uncharacterized protein LOC116851349 isoform X1 n=1 Tax=Odontomachus brunneus TaxID=486640 RepID=UPI0013F1EC69|nr:uncharacterized protein LOC116851349 isoform X1 [Odontomachus brunneus]XP_032686565.1 uncharacterized protein LOC116851349 isoform X1 [Odontomachus brunneus]